MKALVVLLALSCCLTAEAKRSYAAKAEFRRLNPCPATGLVKGPCAGYVIDHIKALACGGPDAPENMQWQTVADAKAKDRWERIGCSRKADK